MSSDAAELISKQEEEIARYWKMNASSAILFFVRLKSELQKSMKERQNLATYLWLMLIFLNHSDHESMIDNNSNKHLKQVTTNSRCESCSKLEGSETIDILIVNR